MSDLSAFEDFRRSSSPDSLIALLRAHQDGVYTVCLDVLRHPQDAEDAAQEALMKIASGAGALNEPRAFKSWLYRLVYRTAVDHLRRRQARRRHETGRAAVTEPPVSEDARAAVHEAMVRLPDGDRLLLVEYYFEKTPLEELGRREGITKVAAWKRVERAKERLKRGLAGMGVGLGGEELSNVLEAVTPAAAPSGLVGSAIASKAAVLAAGGTAMGTKAVVTAAVIILLALLTGSLWWVLGAPSGKQDALADGSPKGYSIPSSNPSNPALSTTAPTVATDSKEGGPAACRRALASVLPYVRTTDMIRWADGLERLHGGMSRKFETFAREFIASAGADLVQIVKAMLAESEADTAKFLLCAMLGRARDPAGTEILKALTQGSYFAVAQSALYSIGLIRTPDGLSFLKSAWDQVKSTKSPVVATTLKAIGLFGAESIPLLLDAATSNPGVFRDKASYLFLIRGADAVEGLRLLIETETDVSVRKGAAQALAFNVDPEQDETVAELFRKYSAPEVRGGLLYGLMFAWGPPLQEESRTPARTAVADNILAQAAFPTGSLDVDRALIWLGIVASPEKTATLFERFSSLNRETLGPNYDQLLREMMGAYSGMPGFDARLSSLMASASVTPEQRERMRSGGLLRNSPESAAAVIKTNLETLRASVPSDSSFFQSVINLVKAGADDSSLSSALRESYDRCATPEGRFQLMDTLNVALYSAREGATPPVTFLETILRESVEIDARVLAAYDYLSAGSTGPMNPLVLERIAELFGPKMQWAKESSLATGNMRMVQVAPSVIGDYYSQYGKASDTAWLKQVPDTFPYPQILEIKARELLKKALEEECRRAIDAIRLRN